MAELQETCRVSRFAAMGLDDELMASDHRAVRLKMLETSEVAGVN